ncbi:ABC transporter permease [Larkinella terrae]|uniref:FtsX-like permease family protein n=1 Tax=Larkinella terrae TaxID=2025311 RepID=A0A7K0ES37_9BACT|nr:ABC transporter permease [Larkinella terrae]MRS64248.1 FtsX-like permease family protein [Larkinella terrae]
MLRNYLKTTWRSLIRNRNYALINLIGLTLGLGVAIVLFWIVRFEYSFDRYHAKADRLYRLIAKDKFGEMGTSIPQGVIKALNERVPGVENAANAYGYGSDGLRVGQTVFNLKHVFFVPPQFLEMIDVEWVQGSAQQSLSRPFQVVLDEPTARRFFKNADPIGKTIRYNNQFDLVVSGIIRKAPVNSEFQLQLLTSRETLKRIQNEYSNEEYWGGGDSMHHGYVVLKPGVSPSAIEAALKKLALQHQNESAIVAYELLPITEVHRNTETDPDPFNYVIPQWMLNTLMAIGLFLIVIACINFINLATVQAVQRSREIAVRKVLGSSRKQLMYRFFGETAFLVFAAIGLGALLATQLIQNADQLLNTQVAQSQVWDGGAVAFLLMLGFLVTFLAGLYPALVLSGFQPVKVLRGRFSLARSNGFSLRSSLVVTQFVIAQVLVICTLIGTRQIRYFYETDLGFDRKAIVTVKMPDRGNAVLRERFRRQLLDHPEVKDVAFALTTPSSAHNWWWRTIHHHNLPNGEQTFRMQYVDTNYFHFFKIPLIAGRSWTRADTNTVAIINEKAARDLGFRNPEKAIGERLNLEGNQPFTVMGVVKDYHSQSLRSTIVPHVFLYADWNFQLASIRIDPRQQPKALQHIEQYWKAIFPNYYFEASFLDQDLKAFYDDEQKMTNFLTLFAIVGILIGCLGLFGLVSFVVTQRTKEIGVRKVLGATIVSIVSLLSKDFLKLVGVAFAIATPIGWYAMSRFLEEYTYRIDIDWWVFALAGSLAGAIALLTVSVQSIKAALTNPITSLRSE